MIHAAVFAIALWLGCGWRSIFHLKPTQSGIRIAHPPCVDAEMLDLPGIKSESVATDIELSDVKQLSRRAIARVREFTLPPGTPPWLLLHSLQRFDEGMATPTTVRESLLGKVRAGLPESAWIFRAGLPIPRRDIDEDYIDQMGNDEYLAIFAELGFSPDALVAHNITIRDLVYGSQSEVWSSSTSAFSVRAYLAYVDPEAQWTNKFGNPMSLSIMVHALLLRASRPDAREEDLISMAEIVRYATPNQRSSLNAFLPKLQDIVERHEASLKSCQTPEGALWLSGEREAEFGAREAARFRSTMLALRFLLNCRSVHGLREAWIVKAVRFLAQSVVQRYDFDSTAVSADKAARAGFSDVCIAAQAIARWTSSLSAIPD